jgi:hypothetical protein
MPAAFSMYKHSYDSVCPEMPKSYCTARQYLQELFLVWTASQHKTVAGHFIPLAVIGELLHVTLLNEDRP